jgi:hypothetical protein
VCPPGSGFFEILNECVPDDVVSNLVFAQAMQDRRVCPGGVVSTTSDLERLRFCDVVNGTLTIQVTADDADYSALSNLEEITGSFDSSCTSHCAQVRLLWSTPPCRLWHRSKISLLLVQMATRFCGKAETTHLSLMVRHLAFLVPDHCR